MKNLYQKRLLVFCCTIILFYSHASAAVWNFRREIVIKNPGEKFADAVIQIQLQVANFDFSATKADGGDIRFSTDKNLKSDGLPYWVEQWNTGGISNIWVKVPLLKAKANTKIYMFYGNSEAPPVSNGDKTFLFFDDFESTDYSKKWTNSSIGEVLEQDGVLKLKESDGQDGIINAHFDVNGKMIIRTLYQRGNADEHWTRAGIGGWNYFLCFGDHTDFAGTGINYVMLYGANSLLSLKTAPLIKAANKTINDQWRHASFWYDGHNLAGEQDGIKIEWPAKDTKSELSLRTLDNDAWDNFAYITVSPYLASQPGITLGPQQTNKKITN